MKIAFILVMIIFSRIDAAIINDSTKTKQIPEFKLGVGIGTFVFLHGFNIMTYYKGFTLQAEYGLSRENNNKSGFILQVDRSYQFKLCYDLAYLET